MGKRIVSGAALVILSFVVIFCGGRLLLASLLLVSAVSYKELCKAVGAGEEKRFNALEATGVFGMILYYIFLDMANILGTLIFAWSFLFCVGLLMVFMAVYVFSFPKFQAGQVMSAFFSFFYAPVLLSFVYLTRNLPQGIYLVWMIFISSWICDTCAYFSGVTLGRHKLAPVLSPKKSIEGAVGGVLGAAVAGALFAYVLGQIEVSFNPQIWKFALIGGVGAIISQIGDLAASAIKRNYGIKDYGKCIPGHGGVMDRFDSVIFTAPVIYVLAVLYL